MPCQGCQLRCDWRFELTGIKKTLHYGVAHWWNAEHNAKRHEDHRREQRVLCVAVARKLALVHGQSVIPASLLLIATSLHESLLAARKAQGLGIFG